MSNIVLVIVCFLLVTTVILPDMVTARGGGRGGGGRGGGRGGRSGARTSGGKSNGGGHSMWNVGTRIKNLFVKTKGHQIYNYRPPSRISYVCHKCQTPASYPVYHNQPPTYVYEYRRSHSRFSDLYTGLALYNLGRTTARLSNYNHGHHYVPQETESCSMQITSKESKHFEESVIPCFMISTFVQRTSSEVTENYPTESDVTDTDQIDITAADIDVNMWLNSTGDLIEVQPDQDCIVWYNTTDKSMFHTIPCALLQEYAQTMEPPGVPLYVWIPLTVAASIILLWLCRCCKVKVQKEYKEIVLLKEPPVT